MAHGAAEAQLLVDVARRVGIHYADIFGAAAPGYILVGVLVVEIGYSGAWAYRHLRLEGLRPPVVSGGAGVLGRKGGPSRLTLMA